MILGKSSEGLASTNNASLVAGLVRAFSLSGGALLAANLIVAALVMCIAVWAVNASSAASDNWPMIATLLLALTLAVSPVLEAHHLVLVYPTLLYMFVGAYRARPLRAALLRVFMAALFTSLLNSRGLPHHGYAPDTIANIVAKPAWIGLWALIVYSTWRLRRRVRARSRELTLP